MKLLYHKVFNTDSVSFTFKVVPTKSGKATHRGTISRSDNPDPFFEIVIIDGYDIELKVEARDGLTEVSMVRKISRSGEQSEKKAEDLPAVSDASHRS